MKNIECTMVFADESNKDLGQVDLATALDTFRSFPWAEEIKKADKTGCYPTISFAAMPISKKSEYLNVSGLEKGTYSIMIEAFIPGTMLGFIPKTKVAFLDIDGLNPSPTEELINQIYKLPQQELFEWIKNYKT